MVDKPDVFMPLYIGDYLAGTSRLTTEQHGAYMLLIMDYWMNGPPPDDDHALASITKMSLDAWSIARARLEHFFMISGGIWKHKRIEQELAAAYEKKRIAKEKAERAAAARWKNRAEKDKSTKDDASSNASSNASSTTQGKLEECPSPSPSPSDKNNKKTIVKKNRHRLPDDFVLTDRMCDKAVNYWRSRDRPDLNPDHEFATFVAHHRARGSTMANWEAAWQTWYTNAPKFNKPPGDGYANGNRGVKQPFAEQQRQQARQALEELERADGEIHDPGIH